MTFFASFLVSVFGSLFGFLAQHVTKKVALGAAVLAVSAALLGGFYLAIKALVVGLSFTVTNQYLLMGFYMVWPSNAELALSAVISAKVAAFLYRVHSDNLRAVSSVG